MTAIAEQPTVSVASDLVMLPLKQLRPSPLNPRKHFDQVALEELARTMAPPVGVIEPLVARRKNGHFEIIAGERRWRAATLAQLESVPVVIKEMGDAQVLELMVIENNARRDLNALEEADGFKRLLTFGFDIDKLAGRIGHTRKYIYDRVKLLELVPAAQQLLLSGAISAGHAILVARLTPEQQARTIDPHKGGLFTRQAYLWDPEAVDRLMEEKERPLDGMKTVSVRELQGYIDETFRCSDNLDPELFPESVSTIDAAIEAEEKVVSITYKHHVTPENKEGGSRIFGPLSWKRADASFKAFKTCDRSVTGVVVIGPHRGEAFKVCLDKECKVHWAAEKRQREKAAKQRETSTAGTPAKESLEDRWKREEAERKRKQERFEKASEAILEACAVKVKTLPIGKVIAIVLGGEDRDNLGPAEALLGTKGANPAHALRLLALAGLVNGCSPWNMDRFSRETKAALGVDVAAIVKKVDRAAAAEPSEPARAKAKGKK